MANPTRADFDCLSYKNIETSDLLAEMTKFGEVKINYPKKRSTAVTVEWMGALGRSENETLSVALCLFHKFKPHLV